MTIIGWFAVSHHTTQPADHVDSVSTFDISNAAPLSFLSMTAMSHDAGYLIRLPVTTLYQIVQS